MLGIGLPSLRYGEPGSGGPSYMGRAALSGWQGRQGAKRGHCFINGGLAFGFHRMATIS